MGLDFAIDELYATGWNGRDSSGCEHTTAGRIYPSPTRAASEFASAGFDLTLRFVQLFNCYRAEWRDSTGAAAGAVVGQSEAEAAVYALAQLRASAAGVATA